MEGGKGEGTVLLFLQGEKKKKREEWSLDTIAFGIPRPDERGRETVNYTHRIPLRGGRGGEESGGSLYSPAKKGGRKKG